MIRAKLFFGLASVFSLSLGSLAIAACVGDSNENPLVIEPDGGTQPATDGSIPQGDTGTQGGNDGAAAKDAQVAPQTYTCAIAKSPPVVTYGAFTGVDEQNFTMVPIGGAGTVAIVAISQSAGVNSINVGAINTSNNNPGAPSVLTATLNNRAVWVGALGPDLGVLTAGLQSDSTYAFTMYHFLAATLEGGSITSTILPPMTIPTAQSANVRVDVVAQGASDFLVVAIAWDSTNAGYIFTSHYSSGTTTSPPLNMYATGPADFGRNSLLSNGANVDMFYTPQSGSASGLPLVYASGAEVTATATTFPTDAFLLGASVGGVTTFLDAHGTSEANLQLLLGQTSDPLSFDAGGFVPLGLTATEIGASANGTGYDIRVWPITGQAQPIVAGIVPDPAVSGNTGFFWIDSDGITRAHNPITGDGGAPLLTGGNVVGASMWVNALPSFTPIPVAWLTSNGATTPTYSVSYSTIRCE